MKLMCFIAVLSVVSLAQTFSATPLIDFTSGQLYLSTFKGNLYDGANSEPSGAHLTTGLAAAAKVQPLDVNGNPSSSGKIVVVGLGMSNWTEELCKQQAAFSTTVCDKNTFMDQVLRIRPANANLVVIDCALGGADAATWINDSMGDYTNCLNNNLAPRKLSEKQVQVVLWKDANLNPVNPLTSEPGDTPTQYCQNHPTQQACIYEGQVGQIARFVKTRYVNVQQMFVHARIYAGYSVTNQNEPFAYEQGLATKWLVAAQVTQMASGVVDAVAGDLGTAIAPWIGWGPYFWASGTTPRSDGLTYLLADFGSDGVHPSASGILKVANMMMSFYPTSTLTPWFPYKKK